jgi:hypothetical protein
MLNLVCSNCQGPLSTWTGHCYFANEAERRLAMKYKDGQPVLAGDVVKIDGRFRGVVIAAIDHKSYLPGGEDWEYLGAGVIVDTDFAGLVHYTENDDELVLVRRADQRRS